MATTLPDVATAAPEALDETDHQRRRRPRTVDATALIREKDLYL
jgi:hypothetical protein